MLVCRIFFVRGVDGDLLVPFGCADDGEGSILLLALRRGVSTGDLSKLLKLRFPAGGRLDILVDVGVFIVGWVCKSLETID
jgi:hypothetical protein